MSAGSRVASANRSDGDVWIKVTRADRQIRIDYRKSANTLRVASDVPAEEGWVDLSAWESLESDLSEAELESALTRAGSV